MQGTVGDRIGVVAVAFLLPLVPMWGLDGAFAASWEVSGIPGAVVAYGAMVWMVLLALGPWSLVPTASASTSTASPTSTESPEALRRRVVEDLLDAVDDALVEEEWEHEPVGRSLGWCDALDDQRNRDLSSRRLPGGRLA